LHYICGKIAEERLAVLSEARVDDVAMNDTLNTPRTQTGDYLQKIGVRDLPPLTSPFDPGYDPLTLEGHLEQSAHLYSLLKVSMACWMIAREDCTRRKIAAARRANVPVVMGGGPFEIAVAQNELPSYLDLCASVGATRIECGEGFTQLSIIPEQVVKMAAERGLEVQFELGKKHQGTFEKETMRVLISQGSQWLDAGAVQLVIEARESGKNIGLFDEGGALNVCYADQFVEAFGLATVMFEAPNKLSQFALLDHFGPYVHLSNVRLEEVLRVEIYRRGLHSDAFRNPKLRPAFPRHTHNDIEPVPAKAQ
jgi:phosphosulfolactate synthase